MIKNRADNVRSWSDYELTLILLRQFKRVLADQGADLPESQLKSLAEAAAQDQSHADLASVQTALRGAIHESLQLLESWGLSFSQSLNTEMGDMAGWDTTADFLTLANDKINAELRISAGSALLALLGDVSLIDHVQTQADYGAADPEDVDAVIAARVLSRVGR
jgi:hypothetical protein